MPYVNQEQRDKYKRVIDSIDDIVLETKGDLEYIIFYLMKRFMATRVVKYTTLHEVVYAAMHCADEFRRRYLDKREDAALKENGDVGQEL